MPKEIDMIVQNKTALSIGLDSHDRDHVQIPPHSTKQVDDKFYWQFPPHKLKLIKPPVGVEVILDVDTPTPINDSISVEVINPPILVQEISSNFVTTKSNL